MSRANPLTRQVFEVKKGANEGALFAFSPDTLDARVQGFSM